LEEMEQQLPWNRRGVVVPLLLEFIHTFTDCASSWHY
jgi:hypothetical protein